MTSVHLGPASHDLRRRAAVHPVAGVCAGLVAGLAYLGLQVLLAGFVESANPWLPVERMSAMLLGDDVVSDPSFGLNLAGIGLLIHFTVSIVYGRFVDVVVRDAPPLRATLLGAAVGAVMYLLAFHVVAPIAFPWFSGSPQFITLGDHMVFGAVAGIVYWALRRRWAAGATQGR